MCSARYMLHTHPLAHTHSHSLTLTHNRSQPLTTAHTHSHSLTLTRTCLLDAMLYSVSQHRLTCTGAPNQPTYPLTPCHQHRSLTATALSSVLLSDAMWIIKPAVGSAGRDIRICNSGDALAADVQGQTSLSLLSDSHSHCNHS